MRKHNTQITELSKEGKTIYLCGVCHVATQGYYSLLDDFLNGVPDVVLYEGVEGNKEESDYLEIIKKLNPEKYKNLCNQKDYINYSSYWVLSDLHIDDCALIDNRILKLMRILRFFTKIDIKKLISNNMSLFLKVFFQMFILRYSLDLVTHRNNKVISDSFEQLRKHDTICIFYGNNHMKHFIKSYKKIGFKIKEIINLDSGLTGED